MRPTLSLGIKFRKLRLTTKDIKKGFYKGNRTGAMGRHTKYGGYIIEWNKVRTYPVPSLEGFNVCFSFLFFLMISSYCLGLGPFPGSSGMFRHGIC